MTLYYYHKKNKDETFIMGYVILRHSLMVIWHYDFPQWLCGIATFFNSHVAL